MGVVTLHVLSPAAFAYDRLGMTGWAFVNVLDSASRWCVPIFIMASGALMLRPRSPEESLADFYRRRFTRIGIPLVAWSLFYWVFAIVVRGRDLPPTTFLETFISGYPYYHLYFLFIMAGLYAITPILRPFVARASTGILGVVALAALAWAAVDRALLEVGLASPSNGLELFTKFIGYFLAGAWLREARLPPWAGRVSVAVTVGAIALTAAGTALLVEIAGPAHQTFLYAYQSPLTIIVGLSIFIALRVHATSAPRWLAPAAALTFGVYLIHPAFLPFIARVVPVLGGTALPVAYLAQLMVVIVASAVATGFLSRTPGLRRLV